MAANINDQFSEVSTGTRPTTTTVASVRSVSGSSLVCDDLTGWATNTAVHFVTYELDGQGSVVAGTQQDMKGIVSGNTIGSIVVTGGTDIGNKVGDVVQQLPTAAWAKDLADGLLVSHDADGSLSAGVVDTTELADGAVTTAKIDDGAVTTAKIDDGAVTPAKRSGGFAVGEVSPSSSTTVVVDDLDFEPKLIRFTMKRASTTVPIWSYGVSLGTTYHRSVCMAVKVSATAVSRQGTSDEYSLLFVSDTGSVIAAGKVTATASNGFTLTFTNTSAAEWIYEAYA